MLIQAFVAKESLGQITGDELLAIANETVQVVWGYFVAALPEFSV